MQTTSPSSMQHPAIDALRARFPEVDFAPAPLMPRPDSDGCPTLGTARVGDGSSAGATTPPAGAGTASRTSGPDAGASVPSPTPDPAAARIPSRASASDAQLCVRVPADRLLDVMRFLYADPRCKFEQLCDLTCIDYLNFPKATDRYGVIYSLLSLTLGHRLWLKCFVNDPAPEVPSVTGIWKGAEWLEREVWDLFGVKFTGHPDLRRIMTWEGFEAHPLRKDYPLTGQGERENFQKVTRESA